MERQPSRVDFRTFAETIARCRRRVPVLLGLALAFLVLPAAVFCDGAGDGVGTFRERRKLGDAHGAVPDNRRSVGNFSGKELDGFRPDVQSHELGREWFGSREE